MIRQASNLEAALLCFSDSSKTSNESTSTTTSSRNPFQSMKSLNNQDHMRCQVGAINRTPFADSTTTTPTTTTFQNETEENNDDINLKNSDNNSNSGGESGNYTDGSGSNSGSGSGDDESPYEQYMAENGLGGRGEDTLWGWYGDEEDDEFARRKEGTAVRDAWSKAAKLSNPTNDTSAPTSCNQRRKLTSSRDAYMSGGWSRASGSNHHHKNGSLDPKRYSSVLASWINPTPEVSMKLSSQDALNESVNLSSMSMSCCISGFRIVQYTDGECGAEFLVIFCYGSRTFSSWKTGQEFCELADVVHHIHEEFAIVFPQTCETWELVRSHSRAMRCLRVPYLIEKCVALGSFLQCLFNESPTPGLLLCFVQNQNFRVM